MGDFASYLCARAGQLNLRAVGPRNGFIFHAEEDPFFYFMERDALYFAKEMS